MANLKDIGYGIGKYLEISDAAAIPDIGTNRKNLDLLNFKVATNNAYALYNFKDGMIDAYQTETGVDAGTSTNEIYDTSGNYYSGFSSGGNYWGDESDGAVTISTDTQLTVPTKNGSFDGDMLVMNYSSLTIDATKTLTTDQPGRGLLIYVSGDCTINGTLDMTGRGPLANASASGGSDASAAPAGGLKLNFSKSGGSTISGASAFAGSGTPAVTAVANHADSGVTGVQYTFIRQGAAGGAGVGYSTPPVAGAAGTDGTSSSEQLQSGGGGGGGRNGTGAGGAGSYGSCWGGGSGGAPGHDSGPASANSDATIWGGKGGEDQCGLTDLQGRTASSGNPEGGYRVGDAFTIESDDGLESAGTGGLVILVVGGDLSIGASGKIKALGVQGGYRTWSLVGSNSGSGMCLVVYGGTPTNVTSSYISATDPGLTSTPYGSPVGGGVGGDGVVQINSVDADIYNNMTLVSNTQTAQAAPDEGRLMLYEETSIGSTTLDTDLKGYVSRDGGTTYTQIPLTLDTTYETGKTLVSGSVDISGQPSGTSMRYKIETLNQASTKVCRLHGASLLWV